MGIKSVIFKKEREKKVSVEEYNQSKRWMRVASGIVRFEIDEA